MVEDAGNGRRTRWQKKIAPLSLRAVAQTKRKAQKNHATMARVQPLLAALLLTGLMLSRAGDARLIKGRRAGEEVPPRLAAE